MEERNLVFNETLTVEQFKERMNVPRVDVKKGPKTGTLFFTYGSQSGWVSKKGIPENPMFSHCTATDSGESFWLLHEEGKGSAETVATF